MSAFQLPASLLVLMTMMLQPYRESSPVTALSSPKRRFSIQDNVTFFLGPDVYEHFDFHTFQFVCDN